MKYLVVFIGFMVTGVAFAKPTDVNVINPSLNVEVANANPIPVTISPSQESFQFGSAATSFSGSSVSLAVATVPTGKELVVEHVSAVLNLAGVNGLSSVSINRLVYENNVGHYETDGIVCAQQGSTTNGLNHYYSCSSQTLFHVAAGQTLNFFIQAVDSSGGAYQVFVSGHYVPAP